jgi:hypothetical protein
LIIARQLREGHEVDFGGFLIGPRYVIPVSLTLLGSIISIAVSVARRAAPWLVTTLLVAIGITAYAANLHYVAKVFPTVDPRSSISHSRAWTLLVETAREARSANLAVPNVPMAPLTRDFYTWNLKLFEPLLRYELRLPPSEKITFASWDGFTVGVPEQYAASVPSLRPLVELLNLEPEQAH